MEEKTTKLTLLAFLIAPCLLEIFSVLIIGFIGREHWPIVTPTYLMLLLLFIAQHEIRPIRWILIALLSFRFLYLLYSIFLRNTTEVGSVFRHYVLRPSVIPLYIALSIIVAMSYLHQKKYKIQ